MCGSIANDCLANVVENNIIQYSPNVLSTCDSAEFNRASES